MLLNCGVGNYSYENLDCKEIQPVHPKENQSWIFIGRTDAEAEAPKLWPPDAKSWLIGKDPDAGKDWRQEEKGTTEDEMVGWHHQLNGHEFGWTLGVGDGQGGLACCDSWGRKESDMTEWLNNNNTISTHPRDGSLYKGMRTGRQDHLVGEVGGHLSAAYGKKDLSNSDHLSVENFQYEYQFWGRTPQCILPNQEVMCALCYKKPTRTNNAFKYLW